MSYTSHYDSNIALIIVDMQYDFLPPKGSLAISQANDIIAEMRESIEKYKCVVATQDFHPYGHKSFASTHGKTPFSSMTLHGKEQILWPEHCVQNTDGSSIEKTILNTLNNHPNATIVQKGMNIEVDSYSGFFDNDKKQSTKLHSILTQNHIEHIHVCGVATDYCVKFTVLDALELGYRVSVLSNLCRAVNQLANDGEEALNIMQSKGAKILK